MDESGKPPDNSAQGNQDSPITPDTSGGNLESPSSSLDSSLEAPAASTSGASPEPSKKPNPFKKIWEHFNIYLLMFAFILVVAGVVVFVALSKNNKDNNPNTGNSSSDVPSQTLSPSTLNQLANNSVTVGGAKQLLNIESDTEFEGAVLIRGNLQVAGTITAGGSLALPGISVSGESTFGQVEAKTLALTGNGAIQGQLTVQNGLTVNGNGDFSGTVTAGTISTSNLQINGPLEFLHHIEAGGGVPGKADGPALGGGGTSSVNGSDTAGTININTGSNPPAGCFITVYFTQSFSATPNVVVTPVGSSAASLQYYINRTTSNFSVCTVNSAPSSSSFSFDYIAIQ